MPHYVFLYQECISRGRPAGNRAIQSGYGETRPLVPTPDNGLTLTADLANPFPNGLLPATGSSLGAQTFLGQSISFYDPLGLAPYDTRWNTNVQQLSPGQVLLETGYTGNKAVRLLESRNADALPDSWLSTSPVAF